MSFLVKHGKNVAFSYDIEINVLSYKIHLKYHFSNTWGKCHFFIFFAAFQVSYV